jgi:DNA-directed RNA polymerase specialized sigma24 family protein
LQEASLDFLRLYDGPAGVDAVRWLQIAVKHRAWEGARKRRSHEARKRRGATEREVLAAAVEEFDEWVERADAVVQFFAALAHLKPDERTALLLLGLGCSYREICERQSWTHTKVNRCLAEGRAALRALLD